MLAGLSAGERVVTGGNFLVASEAQLRGLFARWELDAPDAGGSDGGAK